MLAKTLLLVAAYLAIANAASLEQEQGPMRFDDYKVYKIRVDSMEQFELLKQNQQQYEVSSITC